MANVLSAGTPQTEHLTVIGTGTVEIVPDMLEFSVSLQHDNSLASQAKEHVDRRAAKVIATARELGLADADIVAAELICQPHYPHHNKPQDGYSAHRTINLRLRDVSVFGLLSDRLLAVPVDRLERVRRRVTDMTVANRQAMQAAVVDARAQADCLAEQFGVVLGQVHAIRPVPARDREWHVGGVAVDSLTGESYENGVVTIESRWEVTFYLDTAGPGRTG